MGSWLLRKFLQVLIIVVICLAIAAVYVVFFVDPTHFKGQINKLLQTHTGYQIEVKGNITWGFRPNFVIRLQDVTLAGPKEFKSPFFIAKDARLSMNFFSLFSSNLVIDKLDIDQMVATIQRQESGSRNIDALITLKAKPEDRVTINEIAINNSTILYQNDQTNRHWALNNATLNIRTMTFNPTSTFGSVKIKGDFVQLDHNIAFNVDTTLAIDSAKKTGTFDPLTIEWNDATLDGTIVVANYPASPVYTGNFSLDALDITDFINSLNPSIAANDTEFGDKASGKFNFTITEATKVIEIPNFEFVFGDGSIKGRSEVNLTPPYSVAFDVTANKVIIWPYLRVVKSLLPAILGKLQLTDPFTTLKTIGIRGKMAGTEIKLRSDFLIDHVNADFAVDKGIVQLGPIMLRAFDGAHNFGLNIDLNKASPQIKLVEQGNNVQLEPWLKLFDLPRIIIGTAELKIALEGNGFTWQAFKANATGGLDFNVKSGTLFGLDLDKLQAYAISNVIDVDAQLRSNKTTDLTKLIKLKSTDWASGQKNSPNTVFDSLQFKNEVKSGVATSSIVLANPSFDMSGSGKISLADSKLDMSLQVTGKIPPPSLAADIGKYVLQLPLTVGVSGALSNPVYDPDLQTYISKIINQMQKSLMNVAVGKMITATGPSAPTPQSAEQIFITSLQGLK